MTRVESDDLEHFFEAHGWGLTALSLVLADTTRGTVAYSPFQEGEIGFVTLTSAAVISKPGMLLTNRGELLAESVVYPALSPSFLKPSRLIVDFERMDPKPGSYLFLDGVYSEYFWHWMMEYLPRVLIARKVGFKGNYVISRDAPAFIPESLALLDIPSERIVTRGSEAWVVESLAVVEAITGTAGHGRKDLTQFPSLLRLLRTGLLRRIPLFNDDVGQETEKPPRVYISRRNATRGRRIRNESELEALLEEFHFNIVVFEERSLREQIQLVVGAKVLAGAHGAGMLHSLFMREGGTVIEFFSPNFLPNTNRFVLETFGHTHVPVAGMKLAEDAEIEPNLQDITLDLAYVRMVLEGLAL